MRFIPACAGNASDGTAIAISIAVHPRMRGERHEIDDYCAAHYGSSPHARGTPIMKKTIIALSRFIPACAGNARTFLPREFQQTVHPRMRGERTDGLPGFPSVCGSSPHARGTPVGEFARPEISRFIPACAGNANSPDINRWITAVHPRMRGERQTVSYKR